MTPTRCSSWREGVAVGSGACKPGCVNDSGCGANETCDVATHGCVCVAGYHRCGGSCLSDSSPSSCGAACSPCPGTANGQATCDGGSCG